MHSNQHIGKLSVWAGLVLVGGCFLAAALQGTDTPATPASGGDAAGSALTPVTHTLRLEEERVWVRIYQRPGLELNFVNLHDNENTSVEAAKTYISRHGGRLVELEHGRGRTVVIRRDGVLHRFDPNRMFTESGLRRSLDYFHNLSEENFALAADFARHVTGLIGLQQDKPVIAVHNNTQGKLTIHDFKPGEWYGEDTRDIFINPSEDPDDFFFTNSPALFRALESMRYNVALMVEQPPDRGSLGNLVDRLGGVYVLVEAEHGHLSRQVAMLEDLGRLLSGLLGQPTTNPDSTYR